MKVFFVIGTRPEAIKLSPVIKEFKKSRKFDVKVCVTAQHREMLDQVMNFFQIIPDFDFNLMKKEQDLFDITIKILHNFREIFKNYRPDLLFVQGDTTTSFAASLASYYEKIPVAHIEAGLRTYDIYSPFPEEINRQLVSRIAKYHFAPTEKAKENLLQERIPESNIFVTGNTVIDALMYTVKAIKEKSIKIKDYCPMDKMDKKIILVTCHRRESFGDSLKNICLAIREIATNNPEVHVVFPVHPNPNVRNPVARFLSSLPNVFLLEPLDYQSFVYLLYKSYLVLTDSGGIQEEAPSLGKPVLVMRENTERVEAIEAGNTKLIGTVKENIVREVQEMLDNKFEYNKMCRANNPYGDGKASKRILKIVSEIFDL